MNNDSETEVRSHPLELLSMERMFKSKLLCIGISFCVVPPVWGQQKTISQGGVTLTYDKAMFSKVEIVESKREPLPHPHDQLNVHPANLLFLFTWERDMPVRLRFMPCKIAL
jgi:hypothetical protein